MAPASRSSKSYTPISRRLTGSIDQISDVIKENAKLMDTVQEVGIELTNSISTLHSLTVKYAGVANSILDVVAPVLSRVPLIPKQASDMMTKLERVTQKIIDAQASTGRTIADVHNGLTTGNVTKLRSQAGELKKLTRTLVAILPR